MTDRHAWRCTVCGYISAAPEPPAPCPICGAPATAFERIIIQKPSDTDDRAEASA